MFVIVTTSEFSATPRILAGGTPPCTTNDGPAIGTAPSRVTVSCQDSANGKRRHDSDYCEKRAGNRTGAEARGDTRERTKINGRFPVVHFCQVHKINGSLYQTDRRTADCQLPVMFGAGGGPLRGQDAGPGEHEACRQQQLSH